MLIKARFWQSHRGDGLTLDDGISASQYQAVAKVSKATATRHLADLLAKGCLVRMPGGGRSTRYAIHAD